MTRERAARCGWAVSSKDAGTRLPQAASGKGARLGTWPGPARPDGEDVLLPSSGKVEMADVGVVVET